MKTCCHCGKTKPLADFYVEKRSKQGRHSRCISCYSLYKKEKRDSDPVYKEKENAHCNRWYQANKEAHKEKRLDYKKRNVGVYLLSTARYRAKKIGLDFSITRDDFIVPECCPLLGLKLSVGSMKDRDSSPSLDRIDSSKGYVKGNVWVISHKANTIKSNATLEEMQRLVDNWRSFHNA